MAISVAVAVADKVADALVNRLKLKISDLKIAPGNEPGAEMGLLVTGEHLKKLRSYIDLGVDEGARTFSSRVKAGMGRSECADPGADGFSLVRRLEAIIVRGPLRAWAGRRALLHAIEDNHLAVAHRHAQGR
jgi:hypothetical protein